MKTSPTGEYGGAKKGKGGSGSGKSGGSEMFGGGPPYYLMYSNAFNPDKPQVRKPVQWKRIFALFLPYAKPQAAVMFCILFNSLMGLVPPLCSLRMIDQAIPQKDMRLLSLYVLAMIGAASGNALVGVLQGFLNARIGQGIMRDLRTSLVSHLHKLPISFFTATKTGEIMNRVSSDVDSIAAVFTGVLVSIATNAFIILTTLVTIFSLNWRLAFMSIAIVPFMILPLWPVGRKMYQVRKLTRQKRDDLQSLMGETLTISGITLVKSFDNEAYERKRFFDVSTDLMDLEIRLSMVGRWFIAIVSAMIIIGPAIVWFTGGWLAIQGYITVGTIVTFIALLGRLYGPASDLASVQVQIVGALAVFERIFEYLDFETEHTKDETGAVAISDLKGEVTFDHVSFSYIEDRPTLEDISFVVKPGQMVAFVGPSGAGKTTITHLVSRFYNPTSGRILLDGVDTKQIQLSSLRKNIGIVTQETYLFHDTIANNLRYANPTASDEDLVKAAQAANIHDYIKSLPEGYDTIVGERGHKLSGGERQRLAIARVLLKDPAILILDEATSSLDSENESLIQNALQPLMAGRTSLVIAHRLSTILAADAIFVMQNGQLVEQGTHANLIKRGQAYARVYQQQFRDLSAG